MIELIWISFNQKKFNYNVLNNPRCLFMSFTIWVCNIIVPSNNTPVSKYKLQYHQPNTHEFHVRRSLPLPEIWSPTKYWCAPRLRKWLLLAIWSRNEEEFWSFNGGFNGGEEEKKSNVGREEKLLKFLKKEREFGFFF